MNYRWPDKVSSFTRTAQRSEYNDNLNSRYMRRYNKNNKGKLIKIGLDCFVVVSICNLFLFLLLPYDYLLITYFNFTERI